MINLATYVALPTSRLGLVRALPPMLFSSMAILGSRISLNVRGVVTGAGGSSVTKVTWDAFRTFGTMFSPIGGRNSLEELELDRRGIIAARLHHEQ